MSDAAITCGACGTTNAADAIVCVSCGALLAAYQTPVGADDVDAASLAPLVADLAATDAPPPPTAPPAIEPVVVVSDVAPPLTEVSYPAAVGAAPSEARVAAPIVDAVPAPPLDEPETAPAELPQERNEVDEQAQITPWESPPSPFDQPPSYNRPAPRRPAWARPVAPSPERRRQIAMPPLERLGKTPPEQLIVAGAALLIGACMMISVTSSSGGAWCFVTLGVIVGVIGLALLGSGIGAITRGGSS